MVGELVPSPVDPANASRDFWTRYHAFRRVRQAVSRPDDPIMSDAEEEASLMRADPFEFHERLEVSEGGRMLAWFLGTGVKPESPEYETNKHLYDADLFVLPAHRRRGVGSSFLPRIVDLLGPADFRAAFEAKAPLDHVVAAIPTRVIMSGAGVLAGMAALAAHPERYVVDYNARCWRQPR